MIGIIIALIWIIGGFAAYEFDIKGWEATKFEKIWMSAIWPLLIPLFVIHFIHNGGHDGREEK